MIPRLFTYPFRYVPCEEVMQAADVLVRKIRSNPGLDRIFGEGKMMGVLLCRDGAGKVTTLYAFSGLAGGKAEIEGFVPPILDCTAADGYFKRREREISLMTTPGPDYCPIKAAKASAELQDWLFSNYIVFNALGERMSVKEIFALNGITPPGGTGECAAPKLLQEAYRLGYKPLAMGEFWYGSSSCGEVRECGRFYPSCTGKCGPLLTWMMRGLEIEPNPLDAVYSGKSPETIYEDGDILVVRKPAGMLSVPGRTKADSLLAFLRKEYGEIHSVHRLDKDTSGLMVFARSLEMKIIMEKQFSERKVKKSYRARLVSGKPFRHRRSGTVALPLSLDYYDRPRQKVDFENGKPAITEYTLLKTLPDGEMELEFRPLTGRSHQIRVHAASPLGLGRPIKGDCLYGSPSAGRLYLHACRLEFLHPRTGDVLVFTDLPDEESSK